MPEENRTEKTYVLSILARNNPGVLLRISGLFSRRNYNILSIVACQTEDTDFSRILIVVAGDDRIVRQVDKQVSKLVDVEKVTVLARDKAVIREHLLVKVCRTQQNSDKLLELASAFRAGILHVEPHSMILELTGDGGTITSFLELLQPYQVQQILRTGAMAMEK